MTTFTQAFYFCTLALFSCNSTTKDYSDNKSKDSLGSVMQPDTSTASVSEAKEEAIANGKYDTTKDSVVYFSDSLFTNLELKLNAISNSKFKEFEDKYRITCALDTNSFLKGKGLVLSNYCDEICESYLTDPNAGIRLVLPSNYDGGIMDLLFSPSCNQFIVFSSYDGPGYSEYYDYRAEIIGFTITEGQGYKTVKPSFQYITKDWSISKIAWIDDNNLALKLYSGDGAHLNYKYFQTNLRTK